jgi:hypothetical protein
MANRRAHSSLRAAPRERTTLQRRTEGRRPALYTDATRSTGYSSSGSGSQWICVPKHAHVVWIDCVRNIDIELRLCFDFIATNCNWHRPGCRVLSSLSSAGCAAARALLTCNRTPCLIRREPLPSQRHDTHTTLHDSCRRPLHVVRSACSFCCSWCWRWSCCCRCNRWRSSSSVPTSSDAVTASSSSRGRFDDGGAVAAAAALSSSTVDGLIGVGRMTGVGAAAGAGAGASAALI